MSKMDLDWQFVKFNALSLEELYSLLSLRQAVFVVEQNCPYLDADGLDKKALHLLGWVDRAGQRELVAYLRVTLPGQRFPEPSLGRVATSDFVRGQGIGKRLMKEGIAQLEADYPNTPIRISAQSYLKAFYQGFGFDVVSDSYLEDNIPHVEMLRK